MSLLEIAKQHTLKVVAMSQGLKVKGLTVVYTDKSSCPASCYFKNNGCYADGVHVKYWWERTSTPITELKNYLQEIATTYIIRHNEAGDIAIPDTDNINPELLNLLIEAYEGHKVYTYTHCKPTPENIALVKHAAQHNFIINFSCETIADVKKALAGGCPAVLVVQTMGDNKTEIEGIKIKSCPFNTNHKVLCSNCKKCTCFNRDYVIAFAAHGNKKTKLDKQGYLLNI